jgi:hypothetical protein
MAAGAGATIGATRIILHSTRTKQDLRSCEVAVYHELRDATRLFTPRG